MKRVDYTTATTEHSTHQPASALGVHPALRVTLLTVALSGSASAENNEMPEVGAPRAPAAIVQVAPEPAPTQLHPGAALAATRSDQVIQLGSIQVSNRTVAAVAVSLNVLGLGIIVIAAFLLMRSRSTRGQLATPVDGTIDASVVDEPYEKTVTPARQEDKTVIVEPEPQPSPVPLKPNDVCATADTYVPDEWLDTSDELQPAPELAPISATAETYIPEEILQSEPLAAAPPVAAAPPSRHLS